jgi:hypothetical protein
MHRPAAAPDRADQRLTRLIAPKSDRILWRTTSRGSDADLDEAQDMLGHGHRERHPARTSGIRAATNRRLSLRAFLHGKYEPAKRTPDALRNAWQLFEQAIDHDKNDGLRR